MYSRAGLNYAEGVLFVQMGDLVNLPDGRMFLCNGAHEGKAVNIANVAYSSMSMSACVSTAYIQATCSLLVGFNLLVVYVRVCSRKLIESFLLVLVRIKSQLVRTAAFSCPSPCLCFALPLRVLRLTIARAIAGLKLVCEPY